MTDDETNISSKVMETRVTSGSSDVNELTKIPSASSYKFGEESFVIDESVKLASETDEPKEDLLYSKDSEMSDTEDRASPGINTVDAVGEDVHRLESEMSGEITVIKPNPSLKPLELAEEIEKTQASSGLDWETGIAAQPMRLEGIKRGSTALGYFDVDIDNTITRAISSPAIRRDHGSPQVVAVHLNFIAVGMSKGTILIIPSKYSAHSADNMDAKMLILGQGDGTRSPVTSICFNQQGDLLFAGYNDGHITVWDVQKGSAARLITGTHDAPVVHMLYLGQDAQVTRQVTRQFRVISGDSKGMVWLISFSVLAWVNRFSFTTTCLFDGRTTSTVLCASALLPEDFSGGTSMSSQGNATSSPGGIGSMMGGVLGDASWRYPSEKSSLAEEGVVIFATYQSAVVAKVTPSVEMYSQLPKPEGIREGSMPFTAWKYLGQPQALAENEPLEASGKVSLLAMAWDRKLQVAKLVKSELKVIGKWTLESPAIGVAWLDDQLLVVITTNGQLSLFAKDGTLIHQANFAVHVPGGEDLVVYHPHFNNIFGNSEKAYHNSIAVRGATLYILGPMHLFICRLLPWKERIQVLRRAGDWMGALNMAMTMYDGQAHGVVDLPKNISAVHEVIMPYLVELILSYVDEVFSYISVASCNQAEKLEGSDNSDAGDSSVPLEIKDQYTRVGGVAVEFCVHIRRTEILFDEILSKFIAAQQKETFLELLEPYILKDMLGSLPPEIMQALVEHYSKKGWLQRIEQCVLHMDISSLDFNQVVRLCREHRLHGALIYLFNKGLDDFRSPLEELLNVSRNSERESASSLGYRMLVYLKYCFSGLAFPPGHGTLSPTRLQSLRSELLQFLLEKSVAPSSTMVTSSFTGVYRNMYHLLELDTEATLDVLRCAFVEEGIQELDHLSHGLANMNIDSNKENHASWRQDALVQETVDAVIHILDMKNLPKDEPTGSSELGIWPSVKDRSYMLEFVAYYVSCEKATISTRILSEILQSFTTEISISSGTQTKDVETSQKKEKQVLALLEVVPEADWNALYVLDLCEKAEFYQACGLIHAISHQYVAALDSYMKDLDDPVHAFAFINVALQELSGSELQSFYSAVISRFPDLVILSRQGAFFLIHDHFNRESEEILSHLQSQPKSHFLYLKTLFEVHLCVTLDVSLLRKGKAWGFFNGRRGKYESVDLYLEKISDFPKFLRDNPVHVTDELIERYLELLCQYESNSVLKFLQTFENYRVEHCLRLCQKYGVIDAAAFLLERVGDAGSALLLTLSGLNEKFVKLDATVSNVVSRAGKEHSSTLLKEEEVVDIQGILRTCIVLCQRNTPRLDPEESETLWFLLLDTFCEPLQDSYSVRENHVRLLAESLGGKVGEESCIIKWKISKSHKGFNALKKLFSLFIKEIVEGMIGHVHLPTIMAKLLTDGGSQEFGDFKVTILGMLGIYGFERRILDTAKSLIEDDTFYTMSLLKKGASHGYAPRSLSCCICSYPLTKNSSRSGIRVFNCGHATHVQCEPQENDQTSREGSLTGCPICMPKKDTKSSKSIVAESGLISKIPSRSHQTPGNLSHFQHENDALENSYRPQQIPRFEMLNNLQKDKKLIDVENIPPLRLAPPAVYHEKVKKGVEYLGGESSNGPAKVEKSSSRIKQFRDLKMKGSSLRLPLKSSIFSSTKEKSGK
ncbi:vacuolar protein sorting-associated protein 8 homolog [Impatiens glandulifera]|uniref:vacuolar protein sorting-associated protein 8 homolog n=1 Tax=Impatiens glandulifera TaxID=253017 RepID=UPI001FB11FBA|nr:vacuolar protein sorting-associated protein 8 homolog [Impatiens glandulifera]